MRRHHRPDDRDRHDRANDSHDGGRRKPHTKARDNDHQPNEKEPRPSKAVGTRGRLPRESTVGQLSSGTDFIRQWLLQTDEEANRKRSESRTAQQKTTPIHLKPQTHGEIGSYSPTPNERLKGGPSRRKRKHHTSSDSSLLEVPVRPKPQSATSSEFETEHAAQREASDRPRKRRRTEASASEATTPSSVSTNPKRETFKKRARHKTREDRYETKKGGERLKDRHDKKLRKKEKRGDRKKAAKKAGEDLMRNFSSKSIGQERLTMRPSQGPGLFRNGRASSPVQRRGILDLAFSEMDFLQRSNKYISSMKEDNISSKSRVEEKRKAATEQDEISTFFESSKLPMQRTPLDMRSASLSNQTTDLLSKVHTQVDSVRSGQQDENSNSFDITTKSSLAFRRSRHSADIPSAFSGRSPTIKYSENVPNSTSKLSGRASTYISWSETQFSPEGKSRDLSKIDRTRASSTPESIRRSLEETGVFRGTGIDLAARRAGRPPHDYQRPSEHEQTRRTDTPGIPEKVVAPAQPSSHAVPSSHADHQPFLEEGADAPNGKGGEVDEGAMKRERLVIEHFDAKLGWHEISESGRYNQVITIAAQKGEIPQQSRSAPIDRLERAQLARVKRPSTTVPLPQPLVSTDGATAESQLRGHSQTRAELENTSPKETAEMNSLARDHKMTMEFGNQPSVQMQRNEPDRSIFLPHFRSTANEQEIHEDVGFGKESQDAPLVPQVRLAEAVHDGSATLHQAADGYYGHSSSYQGLPARGFSAGRSISETHPTHHNARFSLHADTEPYFIHQLPRHLTPYEPSVHRDHLREIEYEELDIITNTNAMTEQADFQDRNQYGGEGYIFTPGDDDVDNAAQHPYEEFDYHGGSHLDSELWNLGSGDVDLADEQYHMEAPCQEAYGESHMIGGDTQQHLPMNPFSPAEQGEGYERYFHAMDDQEQVFWRPHQQY